MTVPARHEAKPFCSIIDWNLAVQSAPGDPNLKPDKQGHVTGASEQIRSGGKFFD
jgi:hypothetical protein